LPRGGNQAIVIAPDFLDGLRQTRRHAPYIAVERIDPATERGQAVFLGLLDHFALRHQFAGQRLGPGTDRGQRGHFLGIDPAAVDNTLYDSFGQRHVA
ncbi:hypothetical protein, partial [Enterococcus faecalis]|uniref:hypothetical protein n=1 Tax=Enterococcus faecalis TaxID=1351 RepID=UPI00403FB235